MFEFAPLSISEILNPAIVAVGLLAAGAALIILLEVVVLLVYRLGSRVVEKLHAPHTGSR